MNKQQTLNQLTQFGLDEVEANIYLHLLENGPRTPLELSRQVNINRSRIYRYLDKLISKKLIEILTDGRGKKLKASNPQNLQLLVEEIEENLKSQKEALPDLISGLIDIPAVSHREFEVKYYYGKEGLKQMLWNHLSASNKEILAFSFRNKNDMVGKTFAEKIREEQVRRKITLYELENETDQGNFWYTDVSNWSKFYKSRHISPKILEIKQYIAVFDKTVSIINWFDGQDVGVEIVNSIYAKTHKQIFWKFWDIAGDYIEEGKHLEKSPKTRVR